MAIPVILDTDIGLDVDDVWALAFLLKCPELDIKLISTATGDTGYRAALVARLLEVAGRTDIPVATGLRLDNMEKTHSAWLGDYVLSDYPGEAIRDGVGAIVDTIRGSKELVTLLSIGPLPNIAAALDRAPDISRNARFVGMHGSLRLGYLGAPKPMREYNVKQHSLSCQTVFEADWEKTITPLDTCGNIILEDERLARIAASTDPLTRAVMENHYLWFEAIRAWPLYKDWDPARRSSVLYDTVAVYLGFSTALLEMETLPVLVTDDGKTLINEAGGPVACATGWRDKDGFLDLLTERLC